jgi:prevent-host-death family protein
MGSSKTVTVPIHEAKSTLSQLVRRAAAGEPIYIGAYGRPEAVLMPLDKRTRKKPVSEAIGCMKGEIWAAEDFDAPLPGELLAAFGYNTEREN